MFIYLTAGIIFHDIETAITNGWMDGWMDGGMDGRMIG